ncbi:MULTISPECIES: DsbC family protein [unclassified Thioalkalivibrio]|uniref:DsbC family protein n=1 Tax=unclassified Thioalkalivibrio TaxID=2621013 RepID=UPI00037F4928|nr:MULTISPECIES: DsbC family protein [unclassified Thioalkalivibrio]
MSLKRALPLAAALAVISTPLMATEAIEEYMARVIPDTEIDSIRETPMEGVFEVRYGTDILYVSEDGRYLIQGNMVDLETRENLTQSALSGVRADMFAAIDDSELVTYSPNGETRGVLNIFTDPNCPYCREIHQDLPEYLSAGIKVRYLMFPVLGRDSPEIMDRIWCAEDREEAMDRAKEGDKLNDIDGSCATPQDQHMAMGQQLGLRGTPALITEGGQQLSGYQEPQAVIERILGSN